MSFLPFALMAAGTVLKAVSAVREGEAMSAAEIANANIAASQAAQARQAGAYEETKIARQKARILSEQRARYAKSGVLITEGSPIEVMADTAAQYEMDIQVNRYNTAIEAGRFDYESRYRRLAAKRYRDFGYTKAFSGVLLTAGSVGAKYGGGGNFAVAGKGGYGSGTPAGVRDMGTYSRLPGR